MSTSRSECRRNFTSMLPTQQETILHTAQDRLRCYVHLENYCSARHPPNHCSTACTTYTQVTGPSQTTTRVESPFQNSTVGNTEVHSTSVLLLEQDGSCLSRILLKHCCSHTCSACAHVKHCIIAIPTGLMPCEVNMHPIYDTSWCLTPLPKS